MDPNTCYDEMMELADSILRDSTDAHDNTDLAEKIQAMDGWIKSGGFLPKLWNKPKTTEGRQEGVMELKVYTVEEVAEMFKVDLRAVRKWLSSGLIRSKKLGRRLYTTNVWLREFFEATNTDTPEK